MFVGTHTHNSKHSWSNYHSVRCPQHAFSLSLSQIESVDCEKHLQTKDTLLFIVTKIIITMKVSRVGVFSLSHLHEPDNNIEDDTLW